MITPRLCFVLLYSENTFNLSRNFNLQKVGDTNWVIENYDFAEMSKSIDELIILNISKDNNYNYDQFISNIKPLIEKSFMPVAIGGGITNYEVAKKYFDNGADKIVINSSFHRNQNRFINKIVDYYGSQSLVASIDYKKQGLENAEVFINGGIEKGLELAQNYTANDYHKPTDEVRDDWDWEGIEQDMDIFTNFIDDLANSDEYPNWYIKSEFRALRDASRKE